MAYEVIYSCPYCGRRDEAANHWVKMFFEEHGCYACQNQIEHDSKRLLNEVFSDKTVDEGEGNG